MADSFIDENLSDWLEPVTVALPTEQYAAWRAAVAAMTKSLDVEGSLRLVRAAHGQLDDATRGWITDKVREQDAAFASTGRDALLHVLASAAVVEILRTERHPRRSLTAVLVESARTCKLSPTIPVMSTTVAETLGDVTRSQRGRAKSLKPLSKEVQRGLDEASDVGLEDVQAWAPVSSYLAAHDNALRLLVERLDDQRAEILALMELQEEELNTLWWSYGARSQRLNESWSSIKPVERRAALAVAELHSLMRRSPSTPSALALLARALGKDTGTKITAARMVEAISAASVDLSKLPDDPLLPFASSVKHLQTVGGDDDTWKKVVQRTIGFDLDEEMTLLELAEQLLRELDVSELL